MKYFTGGTPLKYSMPGLATGPGYSPPPGLPNWAPPMGQYPMGSVTQNEPAGPQGVFFGGAPLKPPHVFFGGTPLKYPVESVTQNEPAGFPGAGFNPRRPRGLLRLARSHFGMYGGGGRGGAGGAMY